MSSSLQHQAETPSHTGEDSADPFSVEPAASNMQRCQLIVKGRVQGVGFRPFVYRLAQRYNISGSIQNSGEGVVIDAQGSDPQLEEFMQRLTLELPKSATIDLIHQKELPANNTQSFCIAPSHALGDKGYHLAADRAICSACKAEFDDPTNRRYHYPFLHCTECGPRYSITSQLPFDRLNTSMSAFDQCTECLAEYHDPHDRRFYSQTNCCPACGPSLSFVTTPSDQQNKQSPGREKSFVYSIDTTANCLKRGQVIAVKGIGGFHLLADATHSQAITQLRKRKHRPSKPLAILFSDRQQFSRYFESDNTDVNTALTILECAESPIVLIPKSHLRQDQNLHRDLAPNNGFIGVMFAYSPLHLLLSRETDTPLVVTSGNVSGKPISFQNTSAVVELSSIADGFLLHDRDIINPIEDSVVQVIDNKVQMLRSARGYTPASYDLTETLLSTPSGETMIGLGGQQKASIALLSHNHVLISPYITDLTSTTSIERYRNILDNLSELIDLKPQWLSHDSHPYYYTTQLAEKLGLPTLAVQHHRAHIAACLFEHNICGDSLAFCWDGNGYGDNQQNWGGECFYCHEGANNGKMEHVGTFSPIHQLGGDQSTLDPKRVTYPCLLQAYRSMSFDEIVALGIDISEAEDKLWRQMLEKQFHVTQTSSVGRLFDVVAVLLGFRKTVSFEGEAACYLQYLAEQSDTVDPNNLDFKNSNVVHNNHYGFSISEREGKYTVDTTQIIRDIVTELKASNVKQRIKKHQLYAIAKKFHLTLVEIMLGLVEKCQAQQVVLTGGCFQNRYLLERTISAMRERSIAVYWPQKLSCNDGGLAVGQVVLGLLTLQNSASGRKPAPVTHDKVEQDAGADTCV